MVLRGINHELIVDFFQDAFDFKIDVFINLRKQIRQKMEGFGASQL